MRAMRWGLAAMVVASLVASAGAASANGGVFLERSRRHFVVGSSGTLSAQVSIPVARRGLLQRGPFYALLTRPNANVSEGHPIPPGTIRLGTFFIDAIGGSRFRVMVSFVTPDLASGEYLVYFCNDPCTVSGFGTIVYGTVSIVMTPLEGRLLTRQARLEQSVRGLHREIRRSEADRIELGASLSSVQRELAMVREQLAQTQERAATQREALEDATSRADTRGTALAAVAAIAGIGLATGGVLLFVRRRRRTRVKVPDTIEELDAMSERDRTG